jgi:hypothetical protein
VYLAPFDYLTFGGKAYGGVETWSAGLKLDTSGTFLTASPRVGAVYPAIEAYWRDVNAVFWSTHTLEFVKMARIEITGLYDSDETQQAEHLFAPPIPGPRTATPGTTQSLPQASLVISLRTAKTRGYAAKGRFYPPPQYAQILNDGTVNAYTSYATPAATMITAINSNAGVGNVIIASRGKGVRNPSSTGKPRYTYPGTGASNLVTGIAIGRVMDTQRRRRRSLPEAPTAVPI